MTNCVTSFKVCWCLAIMHSLSGSYTKSKVCCLLDFSDKPTKHFTKPDRRKRKLTKKDESPAEKPKVITLGVRFSLNVKWSYRKTSWLWNGWHTHHLRDARCSAEDLSDWELTDIHEESGCDEQDEVVSEEVTLAKN